MDNLTFALGFVPPALTFLAEVFNPVTESAIRRGTAATALDLARPNAHALSRQSEARPDLTDDGQKQDDIVRPLADDHPPPPLHDPQTFDRYEHARDIEVAIASTAHGVSKIASLVPTWISITAGLAAVLAEIIGVSSTAIVVVAWAAISGMAGMKYFAEVGYGEVVYTPDRASKLRAIIILVNLLVMEVVGWQWLSSQHPIDNPQTPKFMAGSSFINSDVLFPESDLRERIFSLREPLVPIFRIAPPKHAIIRHGHRRRAVSGFNRSR